MKRLIFCCLFLVAWSIGKSNYVLPNFGNEPRLIEMKSEAGFVTVTTVRGYVTLVLKPNGDPKKWRCKPPRNQDCARVVETGESTYTITWYDSFGIIAGSIQTENYIIYTDLDGAEVIEVD